MVDATGLMGTIRPRQSRRRNAAQDQAFSSYLTFGFQATVCLALFLLAYGLILLGLSPLLDTNQDVQVPTSGDGGTKTRTGGAILTNGEALKPALDPLMEKMKYLPGQGIAGEMAASIKHQLNKFRQSQDLTDAELLQKAANDIQAIRLKRFQASIAAKQDSNLAGSVPGGVSLAMSAKGGLVPGMAKKPTTGFIVLGMHRSGTSMLSGLLVMGTGYVVGGPLIGGAFDNEKGFFERVDAVLQNDEFMNLQEVWWSANVLHYNPDKALDDLKTGKASFEKGRKALAFLNDPENAPWIQKDPRMCITLKTWLPLLNNEPAIVFTYRHPLEVALSLKKRESNFDLEHGLRLWIVYNMKAISNSEGLCRVYSNNEAVLANPLEEVQRISDELTEKCGVPKAPRRIQKEVVERFIDPSLQHHKKQRELDDIESHTLKEFHGCIVKDYHSENKEGTTKYERERQLYLMAMKIYCDFQDESAYKVDYEWPKLE